MKPVSFYMFLLLPALLVAQCPSVQPPCVCAPSIYEPVSIVCDNAGSLTNAMLAIAAARDSRIDSLTVTNTPIPRLAAYSFQGYEIVRLVLNRNQMSDIDPNAFADTLVLSLRELDLKDNQLGDVPQTGVPALQNLVKLYLNKNRINSLSPNAFANYESRDQLLKLELSNNYLQDFDQTPSVFAPLTKLQELSLEANSLTRIPTEALRTQRQTLIDLNLGLNDINNVPVGALDFPNLSSLSLEFNGITRIVPEAFRGIPKLLYLYLTGNKFPQWFPDMFRYIGTLRILGIGETPISVIPANAFQNIRGLIQLEMSDAPVDTIQEGAFQMTPNIQAIIMNKNRLERVRRDMFRGLSKLYTLNLRVNKLNAVDDFAWANLTSLRVLDISSNDLELLSPGTFQNTFLPTTSDARVLYICDNPWVCGERLSWFRQWLRDNMDIQIDKPDCFSVCVTAPDYFPPNWPLRNDDPPAPVTFSPEPDTSTETYAVAAYVGWIILAIILAILLTSILLLAIVRYFVSRRRKKEKVLEEEEEQRIISSAASGYYPASVAGSAYPGSAVDIDLPPATTLDDKPAYWSY